jgi:uncharacterized UBP type Zn finger protein
MLLVEEGMCEHVLNLNTSRLQLDRRSAQTSKWSSTSQKGTKIEMKCTDCDIVEKSILWKCLSCGYIGCGRYSPKQHSLVHYRKTTEDFEQSPLFNSFREGKEKNDDNDDDDTGDEEGEDEKLLMTDEHVLVMNLAGKTIWCYACDKAWDLDFSQTPPYGMRSSTESAMLRLPKEVVLADDDDNHNNEDDGEDSIETAHNSTVSKTESDEFLDPNNTSSSESTITPRKPRQVAAGLQNLGNTCYINATLQALSHWYVKSLIIPKGTLLCCFREKGLTTFPDRFFFFLWMYLVNL